MHTRSPDFTVKKLRACFRANKLLQERKGPSGHVFPRGGSTWGPSAVNRAPHLCCAQGLSLAFETRQHCCAWEVADLSENPSDYL